MGKFSRLGKNTILLFLGSIGGKLISFLMLPLYTKWLSINDYGTVDIVSVYVTLILSLVACCISDAIFVFPKGQEKDVQTGYFSSGILFSICSFSLTAFLFLLTKWGLVHLKTGNSFTDYTWPIYLMIVATFVQGYVQQFARSLDFIKAYAVSGIIQTITIAAFSFWLIPVLGVIGFIYANVFSMIISAVYIFFSIKAYTYISAKLVSIERIKEMLKYSAPLIPNLIIWWLIGALNRPIMEHNLGIASVGLFALANKFPSIVAIFFSIFINSWQISVMEEFKKDNYSDFYNKALQLVFFSLTIVSMVVSFFSKELLLIAADKKFIEAWRFIPVLCIGVLLSSLSGMIGTNFLATKESKYFLYSSVWGVAVSILLNFLLIPIWGLWGASFAVVVAHFVMVIARCVNSWKYVKLKNVPLYISMLLINIIVLLLVYYCKSILYRYIGLTLLLSVLFMLNHKLLSYIKSSLLLVVKKR